MGFSLRSAYIAAEMKTKVEVIAVAIVFMCACADVETWRCEDE
jgi:hypothetical protein